MWFKRKQRDQSEKSNVQPAKQKRISARSNSSSDYQDYHDDDEHGIRMVEDLIQETKDVAKEVSSAIKKSVEKKKDTNANPLHKRHNKAHLEGVCTYVPTKEMTGIDADLTRVCATLSGQMYGARSPESFKLPSELGVEVVLYKDNGKLQETTPGMAVAIKGSTMIIIWCGTRGTSHPMDIVMDGSFAPLASRAWQHTAPFVRAQGGILALVENYMSLYEKEIQEEIAKRGIENVVLTGHSLGGGIAQVAHLYLQGECEKAHSDWQAVASKSSLKIHTVAFAAPMTTVNLKRDDGASARFIDQVGQSMCCFVYEMDVVPRGYGCVHFVNEVLKSAIPELVSDIPVPGVLKWAFGAKSKIQDAMESMIEGNKELIGVMVLYRHIGRVIFYQSCKDPPVQLVDEGFFYKPRMRSGLPPRQNLFRNITYQKESIETLAEMHNFLVGNNAGPGLAYTTQLNDKQMK